MKNLKLFLIGFFAVLITACSKSAPDYSGSWSITYPSQQRILTITQSNENYQLKDELKNTDTNKIIYSGEGNGKINSEGMLEYGTGDLINKINIDLNSGELLMKTYDHQTITFKKQ